MALATQLERATGLGNAGEELLNIEMMGFAISAKRTDSVL